MRMFISFADGWTGSTPEGFTPGLSPPEPIRKQLETAHFTGSPGTEEARKHPENGNAAVFLSIKYVLLTQGWYSILWAYFSSGWKKKIRNHGIYLHKLSSYSGSFYSESSPTHSLPSHDPFFLISLLYGIYTDCTIEVNRCQCKKKKKRQMCVASDCCFLILAIQHQNIRCTIFFSRGTIGPLHFSPSSASARDVIDVNEKVSSLLWKTLPGP